jgi:hypothetical protein
MLENSLGYRGREWRRAGGREKRRKISDIDLESRFDSQPWASDCYDQFDAIGKLPTQFKQIKKGVHKVTFHKCDTDKKCISVC